MPEPESPSKSLPSPPGTPFRIHLICYAALGVLFLYVLIAKYARPLLIDDPVQLSPTSELDATNSIARPGLADSPQDSDSSYEQSPAPGDRKTAAKNVQQRIDPNVATWVELAQLPGIGESVAKRIIAYRAEQAALRHSGKPTPVPVFLRLQDLDPVRGIGEKTLARIAPYLKFPDQPPPGPR